MPFVAAPRKRQRPENQWRTSRNGARTRLTPGAMVRPLVARARSRYHPASPAPRGTGLVRSRRVPASEGRDDPARSRGPADRAYWDVPMASVRSAAPGRSSPGAQRGAFTILRSLEPAPGRLLLPFTAFATAAMRRSIAIIAPRRDTAPSGLRDESAVAMMRVRPCRASPRTGRDASGAGGRRAGRGAETARSRRPRRVRLASVPAPRGRCLCRGQACRPRPRPDSGRDCPSPPPRPARTGRRSCEESGCHPA